MTWRTAIHKQSFWDTNPTSESSAQTGLATHPSSDRCIGRCRIRHFASVATPAEMSAPERFAPKKRSPDVGRDARSWLDKGNHTSNPMDASDGLLATLLRCRVGASYSTNSAFQTNVALSLYGQ